MNIEVKYIAFWSKDYEQCTRHDRAKTIEKAQALVTSPAAYTKATSYGVDRFVKGLHFNAKTGEIADARALLLDEDTIAEAKSLDGYYLIVTSEIDRDDEHIIDTYRELWRIEESFKVTKSEIRTRPVYVRTHKHIKAHFLTCYISLVILHLLQYASGLLVSRICEEISAMSGVNVDANWWVFDHRSDESDRLVDSVGLEELKLKNIRTSDAKKSTDKSQKGQNTT